MPIAAAISFTLHRNSSEQRAEIRGVLPFDLAMIQLYNFSVDIARGMAHNFLMAISAKQNIERAKGAKQERMEILVLVRDLLKLYHGDVVLKGLYGEIKQRDQVAKHG